ncbi:hypothetical protein [Stenotrophomonas nitritireducens]|uniref:hypothetical protein n=1 Tax=Stenotrophomonas nitritireducens TaxID=83617 RepID=UPI003D958D4D
MKKEIRAACAGAAVLVAMAGMQDAHAQRAPWWERQKAAQAAAQADGGETATQADAARPATPQPASQAPLVRREKIEGPGYTWIEAGVARLDVDLYDAGEHGNGGYARGSVAVTDGLYVFGGYDRVSKDWNMGAQQLEVAIDQAEIGLGASLSLSPRADFISELSLLRLGARLDYRDGDYPQDGFSGRDHLYAGKLMLGIRARPVRNLELWAKAGYLRVDDNLLVDHSMVGNIGLQYRFTPEWGLVGEAEFYEDVRFYRLGVRASF